MRVLVATDSFKGSMTAVEAARAAERGLRRAAAECGVEVDVDLCPIADGGEGTLDTLLAADATGAVRTERVTGPMGETIEARWGLLGGGRLGVVEMAEAAGLTLVPDAKRDPTRTTTFGVGQLIGAALDAGVERVLLGLGGSATNDGGSGAAQALGVRFERAEGGVIDEPMRGGVLSEVGSVVFDGLRTELAERRVAVEVACDVTNPLCGEAGAAAVYGPQKGATAEQVVSLDAGLANLAARMAGSGGAMGEGLGEGLATGAFAGAGAAGGFGYGAVAMLGGTLRPGIELVLEAVGFDGRVRRADVVVTGEGRLDEQSLSGKATVGVAAAARRAGVACVALAGGVSGGAGAFAAAGIGEAVAIGEGLEVGEAMRRGAELMEAGAAAWLGRRLGGG
ncbi:MAG: glycerate kinase [Planctomycetota bacterium]